MTFNNWVTSRKGTVGRTDGRIAMHDVASSGDGCLTAIRKTVPDRGSRSDRPRYCVTTPIRAEHTFDLDL